MHGSIADGCKTCAPKREASSLAGSLREQKLFRADKPTKAKRVCTKCMPDAQASAAQKQVAAAKQDAATVAFKKQLREQMAREEAEASMTGGDDSDRQAGDPHALGGGGGDLGRRPGHWISDEPWDAETDLQALERKDLDASTTTLIWRRFRGKALRYGRRGNLYYQNGHFLICNQEHARKVIMNVIGTARIEAADPRQCP